MKNFLRRSAGAAFFIIFLLLGTLSVQAAEPFELHLLDVGQGQSTLVEADGHYMLIDGGGRNASSFTVSYLQQQGVQYLDYIAASHYDEDHISGLIGVLSAFPCGLLLVPPYSGGGELYQSFASAALSNGCTILHSYAGQSYELGSAVVDVVSPVRMDHQLENDMSLGFHISYGDTSVLVCGDAEQESEMDMAQSVEELQADILVADHHGGSTSCTDAFLDVAAPVYTLISCGRDNTYGHPSMEALQRIQNHGSSLYRTDLQGTIVAYSDGAGIWFNTEACTDWSSGTAALTSELAGDAGSGEVPDRSIDAEAGDYQYVCNMNSKKFHYPNCDSVNQMKEENRLYTNHSREELIAEGYKPCGNCNP